MNVLLTCRKLIVLGILFGIISQVQAQKEGAIRFGLDFNYALPSDGGSFAPNFEIKYNLTDKSSLGLRLGRSTRYDLKNSAVAEKEWLNYAATYDNYFHKDGSTSAAFLGAGLGMYKMVGYQEVTRGGLILWVPFEYTSIEKAYDEVKIGFMIRGGIELGKVRLAFEYNFVQKTDFEGVEIKNNYLGIGIGFYLGGGKWKAIKDE